jgi:lipopolysaccharide export system protein LptA
VEKAQKCPFKFFGAKLAGSLVSINECKQRFTQFYSRMPRTKFFLPLQMLIFMLAFALQLNAQNLNYSADNMESVLVNGEQVTQLTGNVQFTQPGRSLFSDFMWKYTSQKQMKFWGNMRLVDADGMTITGDTLVIYELSNLAIVTGNVVMVDKQATLKTPQLTYNINSGKAEYNQGGTIVDEGNTLTSQYGQYDKMAKTMQFRSLVKLKGTEFNMETDSLNYDLTSKMVYFFGKTKIVSEDGIVYSKKGSYNTQTRKGNLQGRSQMESETYLLEGDKIDFNRVEKKGEAHGNVVMFTRSDSATIYCQHAYFDDAKDKSKAFGQLLLKYPMKPDTLYLTADTLQTANNRNPSLRKLTARGATKVYIASLQGICDSLVYQFEDSSIYFFKDPVLWSDKNQITADSIRAQLANNEIDKLYLRQNSFLISRDSLKNYNQIKGKRMIGFFTKNQISKLDVYGNAQSIYFALEADTALLGMNKILCTNMVAHFLANNKLKSVTSITAPEGTFTPIHELQEPDKKLKGFVWREKERPTLNMILSSRYLSPDLVVKPSDTKPKTKAKPKPPKTKAPKKKGKK